MTSGDGVHTYKWDAENRLIEIDYVGTANTSVFAYNGIGERITSADTIGGTTTSRYLWCGDQICQVRDGSDNVQHRNVEEGTYFPAGPWFHGNLVDQLGSVRDGIDLTSGNFHQAFDYTPYGAVAQQAGWHYADYDYQFAGLFMHEASGIEFSGTRPYDPNTGKWLQRDPLREGGGVNLYGYTGGNPINNTDPDGLCPRDWGKILWDAFGPNNPGTQGLLTFIPGAGLDFLFGRLAAGVAVGGADALTAEEAASVVRNTVMPGGNLIGQAGSNPGIREIPGGTKAAEQMFQRLSQGGQDVTPVGYNGARGGQLMQLPNEGYVGYRPVSSSGPPTVDVDAPDAPRLKLKFLP